MTKYLLQLALFHHKSVPCRMLGLAKGDMEKKVYWGILQGITRESGDGHNFIVHMLINSEIVNVYVKTID